MSISQLSSTVVSVSADNVLSILTPILDQVKIS